jgi:hypothetical protein
VKSGEAQAYRQGGDDTTACLPAGSWQQALGQGWAGQFPDKNQGFTLTVPHSLLGLGRVERLQSLHQPAYKLHAFEGVPMSHHDHHDAHHHDSHAEPQRDPDPADSRADAIAAFFAVAIAVTGVLYFVSQQGV